MRGGTDALLTGSVFPIVLFRRARGRTKNEASFPGSSALCLAALYQYGSGPAGRQGWEASKELNKDVRDFSGENLSEDRFY
jgi:hypothetical protein